MTQAAPQAQVREGEPSERRTRFFHGWWVVAGAMVIQALQGSLFFQAFGVYAPFWMAEYGWSRTTVSLIHSLHRTESGLLGPVHGWLIQRYGPQRVVLGGMTLLGAGFVGLGFAQNFPQFIAAFLVMAVGSSLCGFMSIMTLVVNWFERMRARAMALVAFGMSIGGLLVPVVAWLMVAYGWRAVAWGSGALFLVLAWPLARVFVNDPESMGTHRDGVPPVAAAKEGASGEEQMGARRVLRSKEFWLISTGHSAALAIVGAISVHFVIFVGSTLQMAVTTAAAMFTLITVCQMLGQAAGGFLGDRYDKRWLAGGGMAMHTAAMVLLIAAGSVVAVAAAAVLHGLAWGLRGPLMSAMRADYFGRRAFAMVMGYSSLVIMIGAVLGPLVVGLLADLRGDYGLAFGVLAGIGVVGTLAFAILPRVPDSQPRVG